MSARPKSDGGGQGPGRNRGRARNRTGKPTSSHAKFKGACEAISSAIFDYGTNNSDGFVETKKKIEEYIGANYDQGANVRISLETGTLYVPPQPQVPVNGPIPAVAGVIGQPFIAPDPNNNVVGQPFIAAVQAVVGVPHAPLDEFQKMVLSGDIKTWQQEKKKLADNIKKAYSLVLGQCTESLKSKLQQTK
jgi:hypothetical protein